MQKAEKTREKMVFGGRRHRTRMRKRVFLIACILCALMVGLAFHTYQIQKAADTKELQQAIAPWKALRGVTAP